MHHVETSELERAYELREHLQDTLIVDRVREIESR